jgi:hypothetical protein
MSGGLKLVYGIPELIDFCSVQSKQMIWNRRAGGFNFFEVIQEENLCTSKLVSKYFVGNLGGNKNMVLLFVECVEQPLAAHHPKDFQVLVCVDEQEGTHFDASVCMSNLQWDWRNLGDVGLS